MYSIMLVSGVQHSDSAFKYIIKLLNNHCGRSGYPLLYFWLYICAVYYIPVAYLFYNWSLSPLTSFTHFTQPSTPSPPSTTPVFIAALFIVAKIWKCPSADEWIKKMGHTHTMEHCCCCCCSVASVVSDSVRPHRRQPARLPRPWDSPGKNTGVGCHFLLQCPGAVLPKYFEKWVFLTEVRSYPRREMKIESILALFLLYKGHCICHPHWILRPTLWCSYFYLDFAGK